MLPLLTSTTIRLNFDYYLIKVSLAFSTCVYVPDDLVDSSLHDVFKFKDRYYNKRWFD
jgi:hypothetical protein